jgi:hypothetical protein
MKASRQGRHTSIAALAGPRRLGNWTVCEVCTIESSVKQRGERGTEKDRYETGGGGHREENNSGMKRGGGTSRGEQQWWLVEGLTVDQLCRRG